MATSDERKKAKEQRKADKALEREYRKATRAKAKRERTIAKQAAKSYRSVSADKAYCPDCSQWYDPRNKRQNRKHNHL